ncbi:hypothetical protein GUJ93_ZPchr0001g29597 [Zizania palustris]|uniref:Uncharacterized protein n=1 Tax=Zizania palustris TaxID=103762 RepID=A0A8J5RRC7_ZIZPA|nr:hypothetical protein GUJ93_ZPchr0001g29597 [Zizania palustris]
MMGARTYGRTALTDITNHVKKGTCQPPNDNDVRKREEKNRKQREYRARIKAASSLNISGTQQAPDDNEVRKREERNRKQREYRARKKARENSTQKDGMNKFESSPCTSSIDQQSSYGQGYSTDLQASNVLQANDLTLTGYSTVLQASTLLQANELTLAGSILSPYGTGISTILQASSVEDKENYDQEDENISWLHRNDNYVKLHKVDSVNKREGRNIKQREYRARRKAEEIDEYREWIINKKHCGYKRCSHDNMDETDICQTPLQQKNGEQDDTFDSALFEPTHLCSHDEDCLQDADELENTEDNESRQFRGEGTMRPQPHKLLLYGLIGSLTLITKNFYGLNYTKVWLMSFLLEKLDLRRISEVLIFQSLLIQVNIPMT